MAKKIYKGLLCIDIVLIATILYFLYFGFYHWSAETTWLGPDAHSLSIRRDFLGVVYLAVIVPTVLFAISKKPAWLLQAILIVLVGVSWKTDIMQRTLFVNQMCSTARQANEIESFISENELVISSKVKEINELMRDSLGKTDGYKRVESGDMKNYIKAAGLKGDTITISGIEFYNNKVKKVWLHIDFESPVHHTYELMFYPENFEEWEPLSYTKYPLGTNLMVTCSRKYYFSGRKWLLYFEGFCFG